MKVYKVEQTKKLRVKKKSSNKIYKNQSNTIRFVSLKSMPRIQFILKINFWSTV